MHNELTSRSLWENNRLNKKSKFYVFKRSQQLQITTPFKHTGLYIITCYYSFLYEP